MLKVLLIRKIINTFQTWSFNISLNLFSFVKLMFFSNSKKVLKQEKSLLGGLESVLREFKSDLRIL